MRQVSPQPLWIGHAGDGRDFAAIRAVGIRAVVQLAAEEPAIAGPRDLIAVRVPIVDGPGNPAGILALAIRAVAELVARRIPALVCCGAGMSRSPCIAAAALSVASGRPPEAALRSIREGGPCDVSPALWAEVVRLVGSMPTGSPPDADSR